MPTAEGYLRRTMYPDEDWELAIRGGVRRYVDVQEEAVFGSAFRRIAVRLDARGRVLK